MKRVIKNTLIESMGVPDGILDTAESLYDELIRNIDNILGGYKSDSYSKDFDVHYRISDLYIDKFKITIKVNEYNDPNYDDYEVTNYATSLRTRYDTNKGKLKLLNNFSEPDITIVFLVPMDWNVDGIKTYIRNNEEDITNSFSHELMHIYRSYKERYESPESRSSYQASQEINFGIKPLDNFLHLMYFIHSIENVVRPTEFAMYLRQNKVDQKSFLKFLHNNEVYKKLTQAKNFSLTNLKKDLLQYIKQIDYIGSAMEHNMGSTDEEKVDEILRLLYVNLLNHQFQEFMNQVVNRLESLIGIPSSKQEKIDKFVSKINKFRSADDFFKNEEKIFNFVGTNMIKKISKLYAMTNSEKMTESIKNWDLYHKMNKTPKKLSTKLKFK